ncbi:hypothetical protein BN1723_020512 [Verticillium longisporum]|uniref:Uncharacterized protein n=1 Tax=Verticillium longisporum TaxID=100787 RepID=A0A0G4NP93_VERLO|nr:hypothetical protein BN1723_020512 [Verticillium longisporum]
MAWRMPKMSSTRSTPFWVLVSGHCRLPTPTSRHQRRSTRRQSASRASTRTSTRVVS